MFAVGDYVVCVKAYGSVDVGETGRLVHIMRYYPEYGVEWEIERDVRHDCLGRCKTKHGFYVPEISIRIQAPPDLGDLECYTSDISSLFG